MAFIASAARVAETAAAPGTSAFALGGAVSDYRRFNAISGIATSDTLPYYAVCPGVGWEKGIGTYSAANTLTRTTILENSAGTTSAINFTDTTTVFLAYPGVAKLIEYATAKTTPADADLLGLVDSAASNVLKGLTWSNVKATLKTYFDSLTTTLTNKTLSTGTVLGADITGGDFAQTRTMFKDCGATFLDKGNSSTTAQAVDYTAGSHQKITATGNFTLTFSNWPPSGNLGAVLLEATNFGAFTVTWGTTITWVSPDGTTTTSVSTWLAANTGRTAFQTSGTDWLKFWTRDGGTTVYGGFAA